MRAQPKSIGDEECDRLNSEVYRGKRAELAKSLAVLLERRSKLLGLDAPVQKPTDATEAKTGSLAELEQKLALVQGGKS
jgi:hypothetical protein